MKVMLKIAAVAAALFTANSALALDLQNWSMKVAANRIMPKVQSGDMTGPSLSGTKVDVEGDTQPTVAFEYRYDSRFSSEIVLGTPYKHNLVGAGAVAGVGKTGSVKSLPPTVFGQYHFLDEQTLFRPYVGLGVTYAYFYGETGSAALTAMTQAGSSTPTTFSVDNKWAVSPQVGVHYRIDQRWYLNLVAVKTFLKTKAHFSTGQTIDMTLNPLSVSMGLGYHF